MMIKKYADNAWTVREGERKYYAEYREVAKNYHQFSIAVVVGFAEGFMLFGIEVYSVHYWAVDPASVASSIVSLFLRAQIRDRPVELVYEFGGTLPIPPVLATRSRGVQ